MYNNFPDEWNKFLERVKCSSEEERKNLIIGLMMAVSPGDGITAFGSGHGGESSEDGGGGPLHRIQVDESAARSSEIELQASPILNPSSFTSDQNDEQLLSTESPSNIDTETERVINWHDMNKTFLPLAFEEFLAIFAIKFGAGDSVPENSKILLSLSQLCSGVAAFLCSGGYIFERCKAKWARAMIAGGVVGVAFTLVLAIGSLIANFK